MSDTVTAIPICPSVVECASEVPICPSGVDDETRIPRGTSYECPVHDPKIIPIAPPRKTLGAHSKSRPSGAPSEAPGTTFKKEKGSPFSCGTCGYMFFRKKDLEDHQKLFCWNRKANDDPNCNHGVELEDDDGESESDDVDCGDDKIGHPNGPHGLINLGFRPREPCREPQTAAVAQVVERSPSPESSRSHLKRQRSSPSPGEKEKSSPLQRRCIRESRYNFTIAKLEW